MCGIAGLYGHGDPGGQVDRRVLARMARSLAHRGPDGEGFFVDGALGLAHRRLHERTVSDRICRDRILRRER